MPLSKLAKEGKINQKASTRDSQSTIVNAPIEKVWETLIDIAEWPNWNKDIKKVKFDKVEEGATFKLHLANSRVFTSKFERIDKENILSWTSKTLWIKAIQVWSLEKTEEYQTIVTVEESMQGFLIPFIISHYRLHFSLINWLSYLKSESEKELV